ncbi:hypothetical protein LLUL8_pA06 (plasmid) [Lactococcus lactis subsp. lactis]|nr:hypothetical protein LLUL8_pA06 [Lactococcus lactis subsp. lactis]
MSVVFAHSFFDDFDLYFYIFEKNKKRRSLLYIYHIYFNLLFFCVKKESIFSRLYRIIYQQKTVYIPTKNCAYTNKKLCIYQLLCLFRWYIMI